MPLTRGRAGGKAHAPSPPARPRLRSALECAGTRVNAAFLPAPPRPQDGRRPARGPRLRRGAPLSPAGRLRALGGLGRARLPRPPRPRRHRGRAPRRRAGVGAGRAALGRTRGVAARRPPTGALGRGRRSALSGAGRPQPGRARAGHRRPAGSRQSRSSARARGLDRQPRHHGAGRGRRRQGGHRVGAGERQRRGVRRAVLVPPRRRRRRAAIPAGEHARCDVGLPHAALPAFRLGGGAHRRRAELRPRAADRAHLRAARPHAAGPWHAGARRRRPGTAPTPAR